jgi:hypothetical protein
MHPILFTIPGLHLPVRAYGTLLVAGFLVGLWRTMRLCRHRMAAEPEGSPRRIDPDSIFDLGIMGLLLGLAGARLTFVVLDWANFVHHPVDAFKIWSGGLTLQGGMFFGILYMVWFCRRKKMALLSADSAACSTAAATAASAICPGASVFPMSSIRACSRRRATPRRSMPRSSIWRSSSFCSGGSGDRAATASCSSVISQCTASIASSSSRSASGRRPR